MTIRSNAAEPNYYSLLYFDRQNNVNPNTRKKLDGASSYDPIDIYIKNAANCAKSAQYFGLSYSVITNNKALVDERMAALAINHLPVIEHRFQLDVPKKIRFYAAHFKLELFSLFATGAWGERVGLIDTDTVFLKKLDTDTGPVDALYVYDISSQIRRSYGDNVPAESVGQITGVSSPDARWFGGEALVGSAAAFKALAIQTEAVWPGYLKCMDRLFHVGDEAVTSAALNTLRLNGYPIVEWSQGGPIRRWFTATTLHRQLTFGEALPGCCLLHLPTDKEFLANRSNQPYTPESFIADFRQYARRKLLPRRIYSSLRNMVPGQQRRYTAAL